MLFIKQLATIPAGESTWAKFFNFEKVFASLDSQGNYDDREKRGLTSLMVSYITILSLLYVPFIVLSPMCVFTRNESDVKLNYSKFK